MEDKNEELKRIMSSEGYSLFVNLVAGFASLGVLYEEGFSQHIIPLDEINVNFTSEDGNELEETYYMPKIDFLAKVLNVPADEAVRIHRITYLMFRALESANYVMNNRTNVDVGGGLVVTDNEDGLRTMFSYKDLAVGNDSLLRDSIEDAAEAGDVLERELLAEELNTSKIEATNVLAQAQIVSDLLHLRSAFLERTFGSNKMIDDSIHPIGNYESNEEETLGSINDDIINEPLKSIPAKPSKATESKATESKYLLTDVLDDVKAFIKQQYISRMTALRVEQLKGNDSVIDHENSERIAMLNTFLDPVVEILGKRYANETYPTSFWIEKTLYLLIGLGV